MEWKYLPVVGVPGELEVKKTNAFIAYLRAVFQQEYELFPVE